MHISTGIRNKKRQRDRDRERSHNKITANADNTHTVNYVPVIAGGGASGSHRGLENLKK